MTWVKKVSPTGEMYKTKNGNLDGQVSSRVGKKNGWYWSVSTPNEIIFSGTARTLYLAKIACVAALKK